MTREALQAEMESRGYVEIHEHDVTRFRTGQRVRNHGHQWSEAIDRGTATVLAVMFKEKSAWTQSWGSPDVELIVQRDDGTIGQWANYSTDLAHEQHREVTHG